MSRLPFDLSIPKPCTQQWSEMPGSSISRHCASCNTQVHNLAALTPRQIERLVFESDGQVCGRMIQGLDGEIVFRSGMFPTTGATLVMAASLAILPAAANAQQDDPVKAETQQTDQIKPTPCVVDPTALSGVVTDNQGALVVGADITLRSQGQAVASTKSDQAGCFQFAVAPGNYEVEVAAQGFALRSKAISFGDSPTRLNEISLTPGTQVSIQVTATNPETYATMGTLAITYNHWYQRFGYRLRHPIAFLKYKLHHTHS
jgi:hypothetical protein